MKITIFVSTAVAAAAALFATCAQASSASAAVGIDAQLLATDSSTPSMSWGMSGSPSWYEYAGASTIAAELDYHSTTVDLLTADLTSDPNQSALSSVSSNALRATTNTTAVAGGASSNALVNLGQPNTAVFITLSAHSTLDLTVNYTLTADTTTDTAHFDESASAGVYFLLTSFNDLSNLLANPDQVSIASGETRYGLGAVGDVSKSGSFTTTVANTTDADESFTYFIAAQADSYSALGAASPAPEPASLALMLAGLGLLEMKARRKGTV